MLTQQQILAFAVYEIRQLLAHKLGSDGESDPSVRAAAHLAYVLHNQAEAILRGESFDPQLAVVSLDNVDRLLETRFQDRLCDVVGNPSPKISK